MEVSIADAVAIAVDMSVRGVGVAGVVIPVSTAIAQPVVVVAPDYDATVGSEGTDDKCPRSCAAGTYQTSVPNNGNQ